MWGGYCGGKWLWKKARQARKQDDTAESHVEGGVITVASLSPHANTGSWTAHQKPDALNYRVGPHPGRPFKCLMRQTTEKDPKRGSPLSAWMGGTMEKDWPKRPSDRQLQKAWKKTDKALRPAAEAVLILAQLVPPGSCKPSICTIFTLNSHWGRDATGKRKSSLLPLWNLVKLLSVYLFSVTFFIVINLCHYIGLL